MSNNDLDCRKCGAQHHPMEGCNYKGPVQVKWIDSSSPGTWQEHDHVMDLTPLMITTVGYVQNETDEFITIAGHIAKYSVTGIMCIPKVSIENIEVLQSPDVPNDGGSGD